MTCKIILASHGRFASGIHSSLELICGQKAAIETLDCYLEEDFDLTKTVDEVMDCYAGQKLLVITDIFGGSVNNEFLRYSSRSDFYLVAGLNLPFLIELITRLEVVELDKDLIQETLQNSKESIQLCNDLFNQEIEEEEF